MEAWLNSIWYGPRKAPWLLRPLAWLFAALVALRRLAYARGWFRSTRLPLPVIVVGNLTVGGTGKTPLTLWLVEQLQQRGLRPAVVMRGYGGSCARSGRTTRVTATHSAAEVGDEALLIAQRSGCIVVVARDRVAAARHAIDEGAQLIIADDGLQHLRLWRDLEIIVVDGVRRFGNGWMLPAGPLREPLQRLGGNAIVVQNGGETPVCAGALRMQVTGNSLRRVDGQGSPEPLSAWRHRSVHALAAIGNPDRFFALLESAGLQLDRHVLPDHHALTPQVLQRHQGHPLLMTEKDAVKCRGFAQPEHWYLPVQAIFSDTDTHRLLGRIMMEARLLDLLVCPLCKGPLVFDKSSQELVCRAERLAYPVRDGIPVMLEEEARQLPADDPRLAR